MICPHDLRNSQISSAFRRKKKRPWVHALVCVSYVLKVALLLHLFLSASVMLMSVFARSWYKRYCMCVTFSFTVFYLSFLYIYFRAPHKNEWVWFDELLLLSLALMVGSKSDVLKRALLRRAMYSFWWHTARLSCYLCMRYDANVYTTSRAIKLPYLIWLLLFFYGLMPSNIDGSQFRSLRKIRTPYRSQNNLY